MAWGRLGNACPGDPSKWTMRRRAEEGETPLLVLPSLTWEGASFPSARLRCTSQELERFLVPAGEAGRPRQGVR